MMKKLFYSIFVASAFLMSTQINAQTNDKVTLSTTSKKPANPKKVTVVKKEKASLSAASKKTVTTVEKKKTTEPKKAVNSAPKLGVMNKKDEK